MGTWAIQEDKIPAVIQEIKDFKKRVYSIAGDDSLFDHLQRAINRLEELAKAREVEGKDKESADRLAEATGQGYGTDGGMENAEKWAKLDGVREFPIQEISRIQEALLPLGYMVEGFQNYRCSGHDLILYLTPNGCLPFGKHPTVPIGV